MPYIKVPFNAFKEVEKRLKYKFWDKERERSNHAAMLADQAKSAVRRVPLCPMRHDRIAWSGPPHDKIRTYVCLRCYGCACEPEIKDMGYDFDTVPDWIIYQIMDEDLKRQAAGNPKSFFMPGGIGEGDF